MKKLLFSLIAIGFLATTITSCQSNQKGTAETDTDTTTVTKVDTTASASTATTPANATRVKSILDVSPTIRVKAPQFSNEDVNNGFARFEPMKQEYIAAINSKDASRIKAVTAKYLEWVKEASAYGSKVTGDENQIYVDHYTTLVAQWDQLTKKIKK